MIIIKSPEDIKKLKKACKISADVLQYAGEQINAGMSTYELDKLIHDYIIAAGAKPSFLGYGGFKGNACISINDEVIHGIPSKKTIIRSGDMICNGSMAPSYPGPASILIISGANMAIRTDTGMNMSSRRSNDFFNSLLNSSKRLSARIDDILGSMTPVTAVNNERIILCIL